MTCELFRACLLVLTLIVACLFDIRRRRIPNLLTLSALCIGLVVAGTESGLAGMIIASEGIAMAFLAVIAYAVRLLGAGDVKLLMAVGAFTGPHFMEAALFGTALSGGILGTAWVTLRCRTPLPYACAITLGVLLASCVRYGT
jgi:prepilin peptidase CpaA